MVELQYCWSFGKCRVPLHYHRTQVDFGPEWVAPDRVLYVGHIELFDI